ncbi:hypothetical protein EHS25_003468 [Saitozyma podzolica]|uniref:Tetrahydrofolate dehydrogenase/cyclohydrolase catalytic domain-containing protein n=1 Tax=Saitozyma podzolica TaxID=1890683 RepID=A0A427Y7B1_9TREE|nr:hypothetical protein EHS25_003468 [Saitozyma podzolica]
MQNASLSPVMAAAPLTRTSTSSSDSTSLSTRSAASNDSSTTLVGALEIKGCPTPPLKVLDVCHDCAAVLPPVDHRLDPHPVNRRLGTKIPLNALADALTCSLSASLTSMDRAPCLRVILATNDAGCKTYLAQMHKVCSSLGVALDPVDLRNRHDQFRAIRKTIWSANRDDSVDGLLVLFPIFAPTYPEKDDALRALIDPRIDAEGTHPSHLAATNSSERGEELIYPCTPLAVMLALHRVPGLFDSGAPMEQSLRGKTVTMINRSEIVGRPLAGMIANCGALVYSIDADSTHIYHRHRLHRASHPSFCLRASSGPPLHTCLAHSDIIISAVPSAKFKVPTHHIRPGATCINISEHDNFEDDVAARAGHVAGRIGRLTNLVLVMNVLALAARHRHRQ